MKKIFLLLLIFSVVVFPQTVYQPIYSDVYEFLSRACQKGLIQFDDQIKPVPRKYIMEKLIEINTAQNKLTALEKEELQFHMADYKIEYQMLNKYPECNSVFSDVDGKSKISFADSHSGRLRLFSYSDSLFKLNVSPILGYEVGVKDNKTITHLWNGLYFYGYLSNYIGFSFDFRDNSETGKSIDIEKKFTPATGIIIASSSDNNIQYSEIHTTLSADWSWGNITAGKDFLEWGYGESGKLVLSQKAPSFPFIRLDIQPVDWLKFNYIHAWLSSDVIDSTAIYSSLWSGNRNERIQYREKYLASHTLTIMPARGLNLSIGESIIYSDKLEFSYLMPLMFFRLADHYLSKGKNNAGSNSQFFASISSRNHIKNTHLYGTLFIDEISTEAFGDPENERNQFGFTLGGSIIDIPVDNFTFTVEYTKIFPFVYRHFIPTLTYENSSYLLGHWMGHNADLIYSSLKYKISRGLQLMFWAEYIRKGGDGKAEDQYIQPQPQFLFGPNKRYTYTGLELKYEILHELFVKSRFVYNHTKDEQTNGSVLKSGVKEFYLSLYYGL